MTIRNITKNMRRIMFTQPKNSRFHCEYENIGSVAAGLAVKMSMQFETTEPGDFHDFIEILTEGHAQPYRLNLHALIPAPDIQFEPVVNLKFIPMGQEKSEFLEFKNEGRVGGHVSLREEVRSKPGISIEPEEFEIEPDQVVRVRVGMTATQADVISKNLVVVIDNNEDDKHLIEVTATCVQQQLSIVFDEGGGMKSSLNFGTLYMGERREYPAYLVNNGPQPVPFKFSFL